ncbi:MAG: Hsp20/alpha crystallin family protein [Gemmatimonadaceae bacterium]
MTHIPIRKDLESQQALPVFQELARRMEQVQQRAFDLFERRGRTEGHDLEDWLAAERDVLGWPAAELKEGAGDFEVDVTLAGFEAKDVDVTATPTELIVHAATEQKASGKNGDVVWSEFGSNDVYRRLAFPERVDANRMTADFDNGTLHVKAPKVKASSAASTSPTAG